MQLNINWTAQVHCWYFKSRKPLREQITDAVTSFPLFSLKEHQTIWIQTKNMLCFVFFIYIYISCLTAFCSACIFQLWGRWNTSLVQIISNIRLALFVLAHAHAHTCAPGCILASVSGKTMCGSENTGAVDEV